MVYTGRPFEVTDCTFVDADNAGGASQAVHYLYETGRRRIAMVTGIPAMRSSTDRLRGYKKGLTTVGLAADRDLVVDSDYTEAGAFAATQRLLSRRRAVRRRRRRLRRRGRRCAACAQEGRTHGAR